jgi:hypothetical protein
MISSASRSFSWRPRTFGKPCRRRAREPLTRSDAEGETTTGHDRQGRCRLSDDRRVVAHSRAGNAGGEADALGAGGDDTEHRPGEGRVALNVEPGVEVVAHFHEVEPGLLGLNRLSDDLFRTIRFREELVADLHAGSPVRTSVALGQVVPPVQANKRAYKI